MGKRLSKIFTRTGDTGTTGLGDGARVSKSGPRIEAIGAVDELNSHVGLLAAEAVPGDLAELLRDIQHDLFDLGGELAIPGTTVLSETYVRRLEKHLEAVNAQLPDLREFILPGGNRQAALCHVARSVCRRAERRLWQLNDSHPMNPAALVYLNRLSDLLFVMARVLARAQGATEIFWEKGRSGRPDQ